MAQFVHNTIAVRELARLRPNSRGSAKSDLRQPRPSHLGKDSLCRLKEFEKTV